MSSLSPKVFWKSHATLVFENCKNLNTFRIVEIFSVRSDPSQSWRLNFFLWNLPYDISVSFYWILNVIQILTSCHLTLMIGVFMKRQKKDLIASFNESLQRGDFNLQDTVDLITKKLFWHFQRHLNPLQFSRTKVSLFFHLLHDMKTFKKKKLWRLRTSKRSQLTCCATFFHEIVTV